MSFGRTYKESDLIGWMSQLRDSLHDFRDLTDKLGTGSDNPALREKIDKARIACKKEIEKLIFAVTSKSSVRKNKDDLEDQIKIFEEICHKVEDKERAIIAIMESEHDKEQGVSKEEIQRKIKMQKIDPKFLEYDEEEVKERNDHLLAVESDILEVKKMWEELKLLVGHNAEDIDIIESSVAKAKFGLHEVKTKKIDTVKLVQERYRQKRMVWGALGVAAVILIIILIAVTNNASKQNSDPD